jgi:recombination protein RecT
MSNVTTIERQNPIVEFKASLDQREEQFKAALPAHIPVERFMRVVLTAAQRNPELLDCDRRSLFNAAMIAAQDGLLPDGREGAMVVRKSKTGKTANWQPMIAGLRKKARNSGEISTWDAHLVRAGDHFQFQLGDAPQVNHTYDLSKPRGDVIGAYSVAVMKDGSKSYEVMSIDEIRAIRDRSDAWKAFKQGFIKSTPWSSDEGEMARKTVARRHSKVLPMSTDLDDLIRRDDELYDMAGASDQTVAKDRPRSIAARLDALSPPPAADPPHDAETGEIVDENNAQQERAAAEAQSAPAAAQDAGGGSDPQGRPPASDPVSAAQNAARAAARNGMGALLDWRENATAAEVDAAEAIVAELSDIAKKADAEKVKGGRK